MGKNINFKLSVSTAGIKEALQKTISETDSAGKRIGATLQNSLNQLQSPHLNVPETNSSPVDGSKESQQATTPTASNQNIANLKIQKLEIAKIQVQDYRMMKLRITALSGVKNIQSVAKPKENRPELSEVSPFTKEIQEPLQPERSRNELTPTEKERKVPVKLFFPKLNFDERLLHNFKRTCVMLKRTWRDFNATLEDSTSIRDAADALYKLGKDGITSLLRLAHPYQKVVMATLAVSAVVKHLCEDYKELEKSAFQASRAFQAGGLTGKNTYRRLSAQAGKIAESGAISRTDAAEGLESARKAAPWVNEEEWTKAIDVAREYSAILGGDFKTAITDITSVLNRQEVSIEDLNASGLQLNMTEWAQVNALNNVYSKRQRNAKILELYAQRMKDADKQEASTLSGMYRRVANQFKNLQTMIGEALAPVVKPVVAVLNVIMQMATGFIKPFIVAAKVIGSVFAPLTALLSKCGGLAKALGTILGMIALVYCIKWVAGMKLVNVAMARTATWMALTGVHWKKNLISIGLYIKQLAVATVAQMRLSKASMFSMFSGGGVRGTGKGLARGLMMVGIGSLGFLKKIPTLFATIFSKFKGLSGLFGIMRGGVGLLGKALLGLSNPIGWVITALTVIYTFWGSVKKGFLQGFGNALEPLIGSSKRVGASFQRLFGGLSRIIGRDGGGGIMGLVGALIQLLSRGLGAAIAVLCHALTGVMNLVEGIVDKIGVACNKVAEMAKSAWQVAKDTGKKFSDWSGLTDQFKKFQKTQTGQFMKLFWNDYKHFLGLGFKAPKKKDAETKNLEPVKFNTQYEDAGAMNQRIQKAILDKNSPAVQQVDILKEIQKQIDAMKTVSEHQYEEAKSTREAIGSLDKTCANIDVGFS